MRSTRAGRQIPRGYDYPVKHRRRPQRGTGGEGRQWPLGCPPSQLLPQSEMSQDFGSVSRAAGEPSRPSHDTRTAARDCARGSSSTGGEAQEVWMGCWCCWAALCPTRGSQRPAKSRVCVLKNSRNFVGEDGGVGSGLAFPLKACQARLPWLCPDALSKCSQGLGLFSFFCSRLK